MAVVKKFGGFIVIINGRVGRGKRLFAWLPIPLVSRGQTLESFARLAWLRHSSLVSLCLPSRLSNNRFRVLAFSQ
jgi:hypothetical protein